MGKKSQGLTGTKILVIILIVLILVAGVLLALKFMKDNSGTSQVSNNNEILKEDEEEKVPISFAGTDRPIAVMLDNNINAMPQAGLLEADLVYEIIVEGGETRLMAVIKGKEIDKIGPIRSARHYFLDYALENDALYVHFGQSPYAKEDIETLNVNSINGIYESESSSSFWRVDDRYAPHNAVTSTRNILNFAKRDGYRTTSNATSVLNYVVDEVNLENGEAAKEVAIPYSAYNTVRYEYDEDTKTYIRYSRDEKQVDWDTEKDIQVKNIIITFAENTTIEDGSGKGRQNLDNLGELDGYYITNGKAEKIVCEKKSRTDKTVYKDLEGNEIDVNDGKTFIQICPIDAEVSFE